MPTAAYLLDTNVVLHLVRGQSFGAYLAATFGLHDTVYRPLVSIITHGELLVMADRNGWGPRKLVTVDLCDDSVLRSYVDVQRYSRGSAGGSRELNS